MSNPTPGFFYFDLGCVLLEFDHETAVEQLANLGPLSTDRVREIVFESALQQSYERGEIDTATFCDIFRARAGVSQSDAAICKAASRRVPHARLALFISLPLACLSSRNRQTQTCVNEASYVFTPQRNVFFSFHTKCITVICDATLPVEILFAGVLPRQSAKALHAMNLREAVRM